MKIFSFLSKDYDKLFQQNVEKFCANMKRQDSSYAKKEYCLFYPSFGNSVKNQLDFIIYGQAVNGWDNQFKIDSFNGSKLTKNAKEYSNTVDDNENTPLDWVNVNWSSGTKAKFLQTVKRKKHPAVFDYNASKSFFWQVTYKLVSDYHKLSRNNPDWSGKMVWSNLMKIAPKEWANPDDIEFEAQKECSIKLFKKEIEEVNPRFVVLLTNMSWAKPFIKGLEETRVNGKHEFIEWAGSYKKTLIIVTKRPYPNGNSEKCVSEILKITGKKK